MCTRIIRSAVIIAAALLSSAALVPSAQADVQTFVDTGVTSPRSESGTARTMSGSRPMSGR
jgi:hypothetical protein